MPYQYLYLVRHGQCDTNVNHTAQGPDDELTEIGREQAQIVAKRITDIDFQHYLVSKYKRTLDTAEYITKEINKEPEISSDIIEIRNPSAIVGLSHEAEAYKHFQEKRRESFKNNEPNWHFADEETFSEVSARVEKLLNDTASLEGDVLCVTHEHFTRFLCAHVLLGRTMEPKEWFYISRRLFGDNTGITVLRRDIETDVWALVRWNDHAHLIKK